MDSVTNSVVVCADVMGSVVAAAVVATSVVVPVVELSEFMASVVLCDIVEVVVEDSVVVVEVVGVCAGVLVTLVGEGRSVGRGDAVVTCADVTGEPVVEATVVVESGLHPYNAAVAMIRKLKDLDGSRSTILIIPTSRSDDKSAMDPMIVQIACV